MLVKELMAELALYDQDLPVVIWENNSYGKGGWTEITYTGQMFANKAWQGPVAIG